MAIRRSARLKDRQPSEEAQAAKPQETAGTMPPVVEEHDEARAAVDQAPASPFASIPMTPTHEPSSRIKPLNAKTPTTGGRVRPSLEEMHPSKARHSTTKQADSGLILGFRPVKKDADGNVVKESLIENTPTKTKDSPSSQLGTPGFDFKSRTQETQLNEDAKKFMESIRGDVGKIKAQMIADKNKQASDAEKAGNAQGDRRFAKPRSMAGRFSAAHMNEFKKMDSIAGHPSAFRATPGRFQPIISDKSLKRTNSKARLDEQQPEKSCTPSKSTSVVNKPVQSPAVTDDRAKRAKHSKADDASTHRSDPTEKDHTSTKPASQRLRPAFRSTLRTPAKSSTARATSVRPTRTSMIPSLMRSPASKALAAPRTPQTEFNPKLKTDLPTLGNLKSILRHRQPLFSRDPVKIAAGTHVTAPDFGLNMLSGNDSDATGAVENVQTPSPKKRVGFNLDTESRDEPLLMSPSATKAPASKGQTATSDVVYPTLPAMTPEKESKTATPVTDNVRTPTIRHVRPSGKLEKKATPLQVLPGVPHGIQNKKRRREDVDEKEDAENIPPANSPSDLRSAKKVKMAPASPSKPSTPSPVKTRPVIPAPSNPSTPSPIKSRPIIPARGTPGRATPGHATPGRTGTPASAKVKGKPSLSMSRLNMLAKPKERH